MNISTEAEVKEFLWVIVKELKVEVNVRDVIRTSNPKTHAFILFKN